MDPFSTLGLPPSFDLDARTIAERKLALSRALHPDRYVGRPAGERRAALSRALEVNEAARCLANPITRAEALLAKWGDENHETPPGPSQMFLMEILELREELRAGLPPQTAIATGYDKASGTIADANITALLAGVALFAFGTGPVKGFAVSLMVGIITSMYTAVSVSRGIATLIYGRRRKLKSVAI